MSRAGLSEHTKLSESLISYQLGLTGYFNVFVLSRRNLVRCFPIFVLYLFFGAHPLRQTVPCFQLLLFSLFFFIPYHEFSFVFLLLWLYTAFFPRNYLFVYSLDKCLHFCALNFLTWAHPFEPKAWNATPDTESEQTVPHAKVVSVNLAADWGDNSLLSQQHMLKVASCQICWLYATLEKIISRVLLHSQMLQNSCNQPPLPPFYGCSDFREEKLLYAETHSCITLVKRWMNFWLWLFFLVFLVGKFWFVFRIKRKETF